MTTESLSILCTGDLHLGRHPTRIPAELDGQSYSPKAVWRSMVEQAIQRDMDAVLISGDVIDRENRYIEAYGPFEEGVTRLNAAEIPTVVVTGNHDFDVLPRLVDSLDLDYFTLLGRDETWDRWTLTNGEIPQLHVDGWSFAHEHVHESPLDTYEPTDADVPVIGLLHTDYGVPESDYAPVERSELEAAGADAWVLGHIHAPGIRHDRDPLVFYPGSPQPLDPGEPGEHGPWHVELGAGGELTAEPVPLATVRYDPLTVDVTGVTDWKDVPGLVHEAVDEYIAADVATRELQLLSVRISLTGRIDCHRELVQHRQSLEDDLQFKRNSLSVRVESLTVNTKPAVDLAELATEDSLVASLAELLLHIENDEIQAIDPDLRATVTDAVKETYSAGAYTPLRKEGRITDPESGDAIALLEQQGRLLLHELVDQSRGDR